MHPVVLFGPGHENFDWPMERAGAYGGLLEQVELVPIKYALSQAPSPHSYPFQQ